MRFRALDGFAGGIEDFERCAAQHAPVAFFQIDHALGEGADGERVGAEEHFLFADADHQRRAAAAAEDEIVFARDDRRDGEGAAQLVERRLEGFFRLEPFGEVLVDQVGDGFRIRFGVELAATGFHRLAQLAEVFDDAVVDDGDPARRMRVGVRFVGLTVGRPAGVTDTGAGLQRRLADPGVEVGQLARRAQALQLARFQQGDARRIIAAIFQPLERFHQTGRRRLVAEDADNTAHSWSTPTAIALI